MPLLFRATILRGDLLWLYVHCSINRRLQQMLTGHSYLHQPRVVCTRQRLHIPIHIAHHLLRKRCQRLVAQHLHLRSNTASPAGEENTCRLFRSIAISVMVVLWGVACGALSFLSFCPPRGLTKSDWGLKITAFQPM